MELNDALRRIVLGHWLLIIASVTIAVVVASVAQDQGPATYTASARIVLDTRPAVSAKESLSLADGARALVTSPSLVQRAIDRAGVARDARDVAQKAVKIRSLGASDVLRLSATDPDPEVARALTDALAAELIAFHRDSSRAGLTEALNDVDRQLAEIAQDHGREQARSISSDVTESASARMRLQSLERQIADLSAQRVRLLTEDALRPRPALVDAARLPVAADPSGTAQALALAVIVGLVAGLGTAGALETLRPHAFGPGSVAAAAGGPLLAYLRNHGRHLPDRRELGAAAQLAVNTHRAEWLIIVGVGGANPALVVDHLRETIEGGARAEDRNEGVELTPTARVVSADSENIVRIHAEGSRAVLLVVAPPVVKLADLDSVRRLQHLSSWPVAGTVVVSQRRPGRRRRRRDIPAASPAAQLHPLPS